MFRSSVVPRDAFMAFDRNGWAFGIGMTGTFMSTCSEAISEATGLQKPLIIVGFSARAAAQCAFRAGFQTIAIDHCADRDLLAYCQVYRSLEDARWVEWISECYPGIPMLLAGGMEHRPNAIHACQQHSNRGGCSGTQLVAMRSLGNWQRWALASGLAWPITWLPSDGIEELKTKRLRYQWLIKSTQGGGGIGITEWNPHDASFNDESILQNPNLYIQQNRSGEPIGVTMLSSEYGSVVVGVASSLGRSTQSFVPKYTYRGSMGPVALHEDQLARLQQFAAMVASETGFVGLWQADFLLDNSELTLLEINPRWSASMEILDATYDVRLVALHCQCSTRSITFEGWSELENKFSKHVLMPSKKSMGKIIMYAKETLLVDEQQSDAWWLDRWQEGSNSSRVHFADIPRTGTEIEAGHPILTCIATGNSLENVRHQLKKIAFV